MVCGEERVFERRVSPGQGAAGEGDGDRGRLAQQSSCSVRLLREAPAETGHPTTRLLMFGEPRTQQPPRAALPRVVRVCPQPAHLVPARRRLVPGLAANLFGRVDRAQGRTEPRRAEQHVAVLPPRGEPQGAALGRGEREEGYQERAGRLAGEECVLARGFFVLLN